MALAPGTPRRSSRLPSQPAEAVFHTGEHAMSTDSQRRTLIRHGFVILLLALCLGLVITAAPHPARWLSAHLSALMTGFMLVIFGLAWRELRLTDAQRR